MNSKIKTTLHHVVNFQCHKDTEERFLKKKKKLMEVPFLGISKWEWTQISQGRGRNIYETLAQVVI